MKDLKKEYSTTKIRTTTAEDWKIQRAKAQAAASASAVTPRISTKRVSRVAHLTSSERRRKRRSNDKVAVSIYKKSLLNLDISYCNYEKMKLIKWWN